MQLKPIWSMRSEIRLLGIEVSYLAFPKLHLACSGVRDVRFLDLDVSVFIFHHFIVKLCWFQSRLYLSTHDNKPWYFGGLMQERKHFVTSTASKNQGQNWDSDWGRDNGTRFSPPFWYQCEHFRKVFQFPFVTGLFPVPIPALVWLTLMGRNLSWVNLRSKNSLPDLSSKQFFFSFDFFQRLQDFCLPCSVGFCAVRVCRSRHQSSVVQSQHSHLKCRTESHKICGSSSSADLHVFTSLAFGPFLHLWQGKTTKKGSLTFLSTRRVDHFELTR